MDVLKIFRNMLPNKEYGYALVGVRVKDPSSRVVGTYYNAGGGTQRIYACSFCRCTIDTESAGWRMTKHAEKNITEHAKTCDVRPKFVNVGRKAVVKALGLDNKTVEALGPDALELLVDVLS